MDHQKSYVAAKKVDLRRLTNAGVVGVTLFETAAVVVEYTVWPRESTIKDNKLEAAYIK